MATWVLTGSPENFEINVERGFDVVGFKERRRRQAADFEPGDEIVFYLTGLQAFGGIVRVRSEVFEDRTPIWPVGTKKYPEAYPWRVETSPVTILDRDTYLPAEWVVDELEHARKWPPEHWHLAFQGQLRTISEADARLLGERIAAAAGNTNVPPASSASPPGAAGSAARVR